MTQRGKVKGHSMLQNSFGWPWNAIRRKESTQRMTSAKLTAKVCIESVCSPSLHDRGLHVHRELHLGHVNDAGGNCGGPDMPVALKATTILSDWNCQ